METSALFAPRRFSGKYWKPGEVQGWWQEGLEASPWDLPDGICIHFLGRPQQCHKLDALEQQMFIVQQFWRLKVQNQGVSRTCCRRTTHTCLFLTSGDCWQSWYYLAYTGMTPASAFVVTWHSPCVFTRLSSYKGTSQIGSGPYK